MSSNFDSILGKETKIKFVKYLVHCILLGIKLGLHSDKKCYAQFSNY